MPALSSLEEKDFGSQWRQRALDRANYLPGDGLASRGGFGKLKGG